jgi:uncharacterized phage-associated protein
MSSDRPDESINEYPPEEIMASLPLRIIPFPVNRAVARYPVDNITANTVADYFLALANECEEPITNMKLNILVYYVQAWSLAVFDRPLFTEEIEAWVHGPVLQSVYDTYRQFRWTPIITGDLDLGKIEQLYSLEQRELLNDITEVYFPKTTYALEQLTQSEDPWIAARAELAPYEPSNNIITHESMRNYYAKMLTMKDEHVDDTSRSSSKQKRA